MEKVENPASRKYLNNEPAEEGLMKTARNKCRASEICLQLKVL